MVVGFSLTTWYRLWVAIQSLGSDLAVRFLARYRWLIPYPLIPHVKSARLWEALCGRAEAACRHFFCRRCPARETGTRNSSGPLGRLLARWLGRSG
jgi:hypothetical protein